MKKIIGLLSFAVIVVIASSCTSGGTKTEAQDAKAVKNTNSDSNYEVNTEKSYVSWEGYKPTGKHNGTVQLKSGSLETKEGKLVGGEFVMDMNSITVLDLKDPDKNAKLKGHLESADFFEVETYPTAKFVVTGVRPITETDLNSGKEKGDIVPTHVVTGNLTMKNITKSISFNARVDMIKDMIRAETNQFFIDRVDWDVRYGSKTLFDNLKDNFVNDEIGIAIMLEANLNQNYASN